MVNEKSWIEFRDSGLFWFVNTTLHAFGWSLVMEMVGNEVIRVFPARVKFRGFSESINGNGYKKLSDYMVDNAEELKKEANE
jgi:hypothetical protein